MKDSVPPAASSGRGVHGFVSRLVGSPWAWCALFALLSGYQIVRAVTADPPPEPPRVYYDVPAFSLTDQFGQAFGSKDLEGRIWIANFIFTHCPTRCRDLTESMKQLQKRLKYMRDAVWLVSFSVDPEHDTPERLREYARANDVSQARWRFLTGDLGEVKTAVVSGFKLPMDPGEPLDADSGLLDITHGTRFVLVDQEGRIRGYYETDPKSIQELLTHVSLLSGFERVPGTTRRFEAARAPGN